MEDPAIRKNNTKNLGTFLFFVMLVASMSHSEVLNIQIAKTVSHVEIVHHVPQCTPKQNALSHLDDMQKFEIYKNVFCTYIDLN